MGTTGVKGASAGAAPTVAHCSGAGFGGRAVQCAQFRKCGAGTEESYNTKHIAADHEQAKEDERRHRCRGLHIVRWVKASARAQAQFLRPLGPAVDDAKGSPGEARRARGGAARAGELRCAQVDRAYPLRWRDQRSQHAGITGSPRPLSMPAPSQTVAGLPRWRISYHKIVAGMWRSIHLV